MSKSKWYSNSFYSLVYLKYMRNIIRLTIVGHSLYQWTFSSGTRTLRYSCYQIVKQQLIITENYFDDDDY